MGTVLHVIQGWDLHPVVDHFTIGILIIAVATDVVGSLLLPTRAWIRYMALTLMVLGTIAAWASVGTGILEAKRVWPHISPGAKQVLHLHAELGKYLAITFGVLTLWRILIQLFAFVARTRAVYLVIAVLACGALFYQGALGGEMVYQYGVGTALMSPTAPSAEATPSATATPGHSPAESASPAPEASTPAPVATPTAEATPSAPATSTPESEASPSPTASAEPSPSASPAPQASPGV